MLLLQLVACKRVARGSVFSTRAVSLEELRALPAHTVELYNTPLQCHIHRDRDRAAPSVTDAQRTGCRTHPAKASGVTLCQTLSTCTGVPFT